MSDVLRLQAGRVGEGSAEADPRRWTALALLSVVNFMVILDAQIVILALPPIERDLGFTAGGSQWVMSAYLLSFGGAFQIGGALGAAIVTTVTVSHTIGADRLPALTGGFRAGFATCSILAGLGLLCALALLPRPGIGRAQDAQPTGPQPADDTGVR